MEIVTLIISVLSGVGVFLGIWIIKSILNLRRVVNTNEVHIVQSANQTTSFGKDTGHGNTYYEWPSWIPVIGVTKTVLPMSNFDVDLHAYESYDKGRLPFIVDVKAFFRIKDSNIAAQRVANFDELMSQLNAIVQGAVRSILASSDIEEIIQGRSTFGEQFTNEVKEQLSAWGCEAVKNIELMDIRDSAGSFVIKNIMEKKKSYIEMQSRQEVAVNSQKAQQTEIEAQREIDLQRQQAKQTVGLRTIEAEREVEMSRQEAAQALKEKEKTTKEKEMAIVQVEHVRKAEIQREMSLIKADEEKQVQILNAEAELEAKLREAKAIETEGQAKASAEKALQLAPVQAQIELAKEIGENKSYQQYLITIEQVKAQRDVGIEQAKALHKADIKVIANAGNPTSGLNSVMDIFSSQGGTQVGAMLEGLANTDMGKAVLNTIGVKEDSGLSH